MNLDEFKLVTLDHIRQVQSNLNTIAIQLIRRGEVHDNSKLEEPEASRFAEIR